MREQKPRRIADSTKNDTALQALFHAGATARGNLSLSPARGALIGLELGTKTIGVAVSDPDRAS